jgi:hypothetical protein
MPAANDTFNYLAVLFSIIVGLAAIELLQAIRGLLTARRRVIPYAPSVIRAATLLLMLAQTWWAAFGLRTHLEWTFGMYASVLLQIVLTYLVVGLALPGIGDGEAMIDLRADYFAHARPFYLLLAAAAVASAAKELVISGHLPERGNLFVHLWIIAASGVQAFSRSDRLHKLLTSLSLLLFAAYVVLLFDRLPG